MTITPRLTSMNAQGTAEQHARSPSVIPRACAEVVYCLCFALFGVPVTHMWLACKKRTHAMQPYSCSTDSIYQRNVLKRRYSSIVMTMLTFAGLKCSGATAFANRPSPVVSRLPARQFHALSSGNAKAQLRKVNSCSHQHCQLL